MAICVYSNGIVEEFRPLELVFTEKELTDSFQNYHTLQSTRLLEIPNTWMLWGEMRNPPDNEYNKLGDEILDAEIYSHIIFIHDSEINPEWKACDDIIYKSYEDFAGLVGKFLDDISKELVRKSQEEMSQEDTSNMIFLITMGHTKDKRVLFAFNPHEQNDMFFVDGSFDKFAFKIFEYIDTNFDPDPKKPFVVFADTKTVVIVEDRYVYDLIDRMLTVFENKEKYELCSKLSIIKDRWRKSHSTENPDTSYVSEHPQDVSIGDVAVKKTRKRKPKTPETDADTKQQ